MPYGYGASQKYYEKAQRSYNAGAGQGNRDQNQGGPPGRGDTGPSQAAIESARIANEAAEARRQAAQEASQALHAQQMQEMARDMKAVGQIGGGLSGGTYTKGPVVYPREFYTDEGWAEVQQRGWSDKLANYEIQGKTPSEWILAGDDPSVEGGLSLKDVGGKLRDLPEGVIYSSNIGSWDEDQRGYGGFKRVSNFIDNNRDGDSGGYSGMWSPGYGGGYGGSGYAAGMPYIPGAQEGIGYSEPAFATDPMQAWMVGVNAPQYAARGGIMNLRR